MKRFKDFIDIDLYEDRYLRRLGLIHVRDQNHAPHCQINPQGRTGAVFPVSVEEAAYLLVGLKQADYTNDQTIEKEFLGNARLKEFIRRRGPEVYQQICFDLEAGLLKDLQFVTLVAWAKDRSDLLTRLPTETAQQMNAAATCLLTGKDQVFRCRSMDAATTHSMESRTGYRYDALIWRNGTLNPKDPLIGMKGTKMNRLRVEVLNAAQGFIAVTGNSSARPIDFVESDCYKNVIEPLPPRERPDRATVKKWIKSVPFNRARGRPRTIVAPL